MRLYEPTPSRGGNPTAARLIGDHVLGDLDQIVTAATGYYGLTKEEADQLESDVERLAQCMESAEASPRIHSIEMRPTREGYELLVRSEILVQKVKGRVKVSAEDERHGKASDSLYNRAYKQAQRLAEKWRTHVSC